MGATQQHGAFAVVVREVGGAFELGSGFVVPVDAIEQVASDCVQGMEPLERAHWFVPGFHPFVSNVSPWTSLPPTVASSLLSTMPWFAR